MTTTAHKIMMVAVLTGIIVTIAPVHAMLDPSAVYCKAMGYTYETVYAKTGDYGVCRMPDNRYVNSWKFLRGEEGQKFSYCSKMGYSSRVSYDLNTCEAIFDAACNVCILPNKSEVEVTRLMNLSFAETFCGDGRCAIAENRKNCPSDCPQSGNDAVCERITDFKCDPDCIDGKGDTDCIYLGNPFVTVLIVLLILIIIAGAGWFILKKKKT